MVRFGAGSGSGEFLEIPGIFGYMGRSFNFASKNTIVIPNDFYVSGRGFRRLTFFGKWFYYELWKIYNFWNFSVRHVNFC